MITETKSMMRLFPKPPSCNRRVGGRDHKGLVPELDNQALYPFNQRSDNPGGWQQEEDKDQQGQEDPCQHIPVSHPAFYHRKEGVQGDGNDGTPDHGFEEGEDDPDAPGDEQEKDSDPEDVVD
jgi:hypothetical protein